MAYKIFLNMPIKNLKRSMDFFTQLGFTFNKQFTSEDATSMIISDEIYCMLLEEARFQEFTKKEVADTSKCNEMIIALSLDDRASVDALADKALKAGAKYYNDPQDHGFMYLRSFLDLDGHIWEIFYMNPEHVA